MVDFILRITDTIFVLSIFGAFACAVILGFTGKTFGRFED